MKAVYAREGDSVRDVMLKHGSLAVLSLDGRMVVKVLCNLQLSVGETVTVTFENGTDTEGRVESTAAFGRLLEEHREYESVLQALLQLYENGVVTADCDGVISGVDEESTLLLENDSTLIDFSLDETVILTVVPQDTMTLTITLDERDIGKVSLGQTAQVQVDALKDRT